MERHAILPYQVLNEAKANNNVVLSCLGAQRRFASSVVSGLDARVLCMCFLFTSYIRSQDHDVSLICGVCFRIKYEWVGIGAGAEQHSTLCQVLKPSLLRRGCALMLIRDAQPFRAIGTPSKGWC